MIIKAPTGLFDKQLPKSNLDSASVVFTISNNLPPPAIPFKVVQLPTSALLQKAPDRVYSEEERRFTLGERVFTVIHGSSKITDSSKKMFEIGQYLEFDNTEEPAEYANIESVVVQHNTNVLDLTSVGLSDAEISELISLSELKRTELRTSIANTQATIAAYDITIVELQKTINETTKVINSVAALYNIKTGAINTGNAVYDKLVSNRSDLIAQKELTISNRSTALATLATLETELRSVAQLTR